ncbi:hypothetical protein JYT87_01555 [Nitrospira defluvii]|nr:hypothetical protein [Nitrospira defluvii]
MRTQWLPVLILTTSNEKSDLIEDDRMGANSFIRKPLDLNKFNEAIKLMGSYWLLLNENPIAPSNG